MNRDAAAAIAEIAYGRIVLRDRDGLVSLLQARN